MAVDINDALDRIDGGNTVGTAPHGGFRRRTHFIYIGCELGKNRNLGPPPGGGCKALHKVRILANIRSQSFLHHVGAGEIELDCICSVLLTLARQTFPFVIILSHDGSQNEL